jgi:hypothetical protein
LQLEEELAQKEEEAQPEVVQESQVLQGLP